MELGPHTATRSIKTPEVSRFHRNNAKRTALIETRSYNKFEFKLKKDNAKYGTHVQWAKFDLSFLLALAKYVTPQLSIQM
ncbi:hypothetical protein KPH14_006600 [Odynerus spinipes]|uniref:Uncharacterized protein n=1 Tax=Odynerus spinipes TaxID=1348599 RepID=A0AAD9RR95_9HYME|nr:hypothetical protein KPH14_006600 [Odynerus spinipes]